MKKALFITLVDIYDNNGNGGVKGSQRNLQLLRDIYGEDNIILVSFPRNEYTAPPQGEIFFSRTQNNFQHLIAALFGCKVYFPWQEDNIFKFINKQNIELLFIDSSMLGRMARIKGEYKKVVFFHNVEANYALNKVKNEGIKFFPSYFSSKYNEKIAMKHADIVICLNERDSIELYNLYKRKADYILPVTLEDKFKLEKCNTTKMAKRRLLFVGAFMPQNIVSIEWFINNVMIHLPDIVLDIVGKGFEKKKDEYLKFKNINIIGEVDDLGEYYYSHLIVVLPIRYGSGMKIKTVEAMMYGRNIIASDEALEGYDIENVAGIYRCNTSDEYIATIRSLMDKKCERYSSSVRELFLSKYETKSLVLKILNGISEV